MMTVSKNSPKLVTTFLATGTTSLREKFGDDVCSYFTPPYTLTVIGLILLDLLIAVEGEELSPSEIVQHVEAVVINDLKLVDEEHPSFQNDPMRQVVAELYSVMVSTIWPFIKDNHLAQATAKITIINFDIMQISLKNLRFIHGT